MFQTNYYKSKQIYTFIDTYLLTYLLTPWSRVLLQKLTGFAASQEFPRIYGTRKFITVFTSVRHLSLS
jgi:hypothetical protein